MNDELYQLAEQLGCKLTKSKLMLATAESCTGGGIGAALTAIPGSSTWYVGGIIAYCNAIKEAMLGVDKQILELHGAVSEETALAMQRGVLRVTQADISVTTTGVAGPSGGTPVKPVGMVCFAYGSISKQHAVTYQFEGDREQVRLKSVITAINLLQNFLDEENTV